MKILVEKVEDKFIIWWQEILKIFIDFQKNIFPEIDKKGRELAEKFDALKESLWFDIRTKYKLFGFDLHCEESTWQIFAQEKDENGKILKSVQMVKKISEDLARRFNNLNKVGAELFETTKKFVFYHNGIAAKLKEFQIAVCERYGIEPRFFLINEQGQLVDIEADSDQTLQTLEKLFAETGEGEKRPHDVTLH